MKISINWIKEFVDLDGIDTDELVKRFNLSTAEIEGVEYKGKETSKVVFGKILEVENHPQSQKLHILKVDVGSEVLQIVCGAPNVRVGMVTCVALVGGAVNGHKITPAKLVGIDSNGMCCSEAELDLGEDDDGIMDILEEVPIGADIKTVLPVDDVVFEIDNKTLTNRPDLWGHYGLAREFAAIFGRKLKKLETVDLTKFDELKAIEVKNSSENCLRYGAIAVDNVTVKKSPLAMAVRLHYAGMRAINLLADITNYVMLELGQPMHAFDHNIVEGIEVLEAKEGDKILTLEGEEHTIPAGAVLIADNKKVPVAIAGIKGGLKASISDETTNVLFESATFDAVAIRKTSRAIGLSTDASQRYEKSLDPELTEIALGRILEVLRHIDKNIVVSSRFSDVYSKHYDLPEIVITADFISSRIGMPIAKDKIVDVLSALDFAVKTKGEQIIVKVPSFRATKDVSMKEDLVEEIARMYGYDNIEPQPLNFKPVPQDLASGVKQEYEVKKMLAVKYNACEIHSYIWNYLDFNKTYHIDTKPVVNLQDSSNAGQSGIRSELIPTLIKVVVENKNVLDDIRVFEVGRVAESLNEEGLVNEKKKLAVCFASKAMTHQEMFNQMKQFIIDYAKVELSLDVSLKEGNKPNFMHPVNTFRICSRENDFGYVGLLHPKTEKAVDKKLNVVCLEVDFGLLSSKQGYFKKAKVPYKFQTVTNDVTIKVPKDKLYGDIEQVVNKFRSKILSGYTLKDIYYPENEDTKSVTLSFELCGRDHTLDGQEIEAFRTALFDHLLKNKFSI